MKKSILLIDDDPIIATLIEGLLGSVFEVSHADTGARGLEMAESLTPDIILLDVGLPDADGYEVCRTLKTSSVTEPIPVLFVSGHVSLEDRLTAYDVGAEHFVAKPIVADELRRKIGVILRNQQKNAELAAQANNASSAAMAAVSSANDVSRILNFFHGMTGMTGFSEIADISLKTLQEYGMQGCIQLRAKTGVLSRNHLGICSPLEESVLNTMATCGRIVELGKRSSFNFPHVSIIVINMPRNDAELYGRFKDHVTMIAEAIDIHMASLELTLDAIHRGDTLLGLLHKNVAALRKIEKHHNDQRERSANILNQLVRDIEDSFIYMGLTEGQEILLQGLARDAAVASQALYDQDIAAQELMTTDAVLRSLGEGLESSLLSELQGATETEDETSRIQLF